MATVTIPLSRMKKYKLIYDMRELGKVEFEFEANREEAGKSYPHPASPHLAANAYMEKHPPGPTVYQYIYYGPSSICPCNNPAFDQNVYDEAVREKRFKEEYFERTGECWQNLDPKKEAPHCALENEPEETNLNFDDCLKLFGLSPGFTNEELKAAYREMVKMNHPDKVASLAPKFQQLAHQETKNINQAHDLLKRKAAQKR